MALDEATQSLGRKKLNELELKTFEASLWQLVPIIKRITVDTIPYTKLEVPSGRS